MNAQSLFTLMLSTVLAGSAAACSGYWWLPMLKTASHAPVESMLNRLSEIGFDGQRFRLRLLLIETTLAAILILTSWSYAGPILGATLLVVAFHLRGWLLKWMIDRRERMLRAQTLELTLGLEGLVRGGMNLSTAVETLTREIPAPLGKLVEKIANDFQRGRPLTDAINAIRNSLRLDDFSLLATSITCALKQGSSLERSLAGVQQSLENRAHAEHQLRGKTSSARATILILGCTPVGFLTMFLLAMPESTMLLWTDSYGRILLSAIIASLYVGVVWAHRLLMIR